MNVKGKQGDGNTAEREMCVFGWNELLVKLLFNKGVLNGFPFTTHWCVASCGVMCVESVRLDELT